MVLHASTLFCMVFDEISNRYSSLVSLFMVPQGEGAVYISPLSFPVKTKFYGKKFIRKGHWCILN